MQRKARFRALWHMAINEADHMVVENIKDIEYSSLLYDFYGDLLGEAQREVMNLYHEADMSLAEIAEEIGQSRQGVHYTLKKAERNLAKFEEKLGLVHRYMESSKALDQADNIIERILDDDDVSDSVKSDVKELHRIIREISE